MFHRILLELYCKILDGAQTLHSTLTQTALLRDVIVGLKLISNTTNRWRDLQRCFSLSINIVSNSFFQEKDKLRKLVPGRPTVTISIKFQGVMYRYPFWEGRGSCPRKAACGSRQSKQGGCREELQK